MKGPVEVILEMAGVSWKVDVGRPVELAVALDFYGEQPRAFGMPPARAKAVEGGGFIGDLRRGGSANCEAVELIPHGNGTHTEGVGHITRERISVGDIDLPPLLPAALLSVAPRRLGESGERYEGDWDARDLVICAADLKGARRDLGVADDFLNTLILRTVRSAEFAGPVRDHSGTNPPYFTTEAITWLREVECDHLLVEFPSVDREEDGGSLPNHHQFFGVLPEQSASKASRARTITEMIDVPSVVKDGEFALALHFPRFMIDAAPSRPILYPLERVSC